MNLTADLPTITHMVATYGAWLLLPLSILEGPIVTVVASALAQAGVLQVKVIFPVLVAGDLIGDVVFYWLGRGGARVLPAGWRRRLGLGDARLDQLSAHFGQDGARTLVIGKLTHSMGAVVLMAAGAARMPLGLFVFWNLVATLPKTAFFMALGWFFATATAAVGVGIWWGSVILGAAVLAVGAGYVLYLRKRKGDR